MDFLKTFSTRWDNIPTIDGSYRLLCSHPTCSLSCANLRSGRLSVTSVHGADRHSYEFTKPDMLFASLMFVNTLSPKELELFTKLFNKISPTLVLSSEQICEE